jgi:hypothetical protein
MLRAKFAGGVTRDAVLRAAWEKLKAERTPHACAWRTACARERDARAVGRNVAARGAHAPGARPGGTAFSELVRARWAGVAGRQAATAIAWAAALARAAPDRMPWADAVAKNAVVRLRWRPGYPYRSGYTIPFGGDPDPPPGSTIIIPPAEVYFMIPALSIVRTSDAADLNAIDASVKLDMSSYAWTLDATIPYSSLPLVNPSTRSEPEAITVTINGYAWSFIVEGFTDNRKFGGTGCKIRGRSPSALLGAPYAPLATFTNTLAKDASQLAAI